MGLDGIVAVSRVILPAQWLLWRSDLFRPKASAKMTPTCLIPFIGLNFQAFDSINPAGIMVGD